MSDENPRDSHLSNIVNNRSPRRNLAQREEFTNEAIKEDQEDPRDATHHDYKYIKSTAGPLFKGEEGEEAPLVEA